MKLVMKPTPLSIIARVNRWVEDAAIHTAVQTEDAYTYLAHRWRITREEAKRRFYSIMWGSV